MTSSDDAIGTLLGIPHNTRSMSDETKLIDKITTNALSKAALQAWLVKQGIPHKLAQAAQPKSIASAYNNRNYLRSWRTRVNPTWAILNGLSDDNAIEAAAENKIAETAIAIDAAQQAALLKSMMDEVHRKINEALANTTVQLDPRAKEDIKEIAKVAAQAKVTELAEPRIIEVHNHKTAEVISLGLQHECFPKLLKACQARTNEGFHLNIWLTGLPGSGKTHAVKSVAKALGYEFEAESSLDSDYKITGYRGPDGHYHDTAFFRRFTQGGVILLDEIDNFSPSALLATNAATANSFAQFPHGHFQRHKDCIVIACANTWGLGATGDFVGRTRLDAASLDRFQPKINWTTDEKLEMAVAAQQAGELGQEWCELVQKSRAKAKAQGLKIIISPRATFSGISLLQAGFDPDEVMEMTFCAGLSEEQKSAINGHKMKSHTNRYVDLLRQSGKIEAIRQYRSDHDCSLYEAKEAIEALESAA